MSFACQHHTGRRAVRGILPTAAPARPVMLGDTPDRSPRPALPVRVRWASAVAGVVRRWAWVSVLTFGTALFAAVHRAFAATANPNFVPTLILLGALVVPAAFVTFIAQRRLPYTLTPAAVALVAILGAVTSVLGAGVLEYDVAHALGTLPTLTVALIEESVKLVVPVAVLWFARLRRLPDGLLIGVATGAGFGALETMGYTASTYVQSPGGLAAADTVMFVRGLLSPAGHIAWTGILTAALWHTAAHHWTPAATARLAVVFAVVVALHTAWDTYHGVLSYAAAAAASLALLTYTTGRLAVPLVLPATCRRTAPRHHPHAPEQQRVAK